MKLRIGVERLKINWQDHNSFYNVRIRHKNFCSKVHLLSFKIVHILQKISLYRSFFNNQSKEQVTGYDLNCNIQRMQRTNSAGANTDVLAYTYTVNTKKVTQIVNTRFVSETYNFTCRWGNRSYV